MTLSLLLLALMASPSHAAEIPAGTKVILTEAYPDPEGAPPRKCGDLVSGKEGVVVASPMNSDELVDVKWNGWKKECGRHEHDTYISPAKLQINVPNKKEATKEPATPPPVSKECKDGPHSDSMEELLHKTDLADQSENKNEDEIDKYVACYYVGDHDDYLSKFKPMIETAAEDFNVDASLMKCLLLRESQYDPMDISCTCATGLGQQVSQNIDEINKWVSDSHGRVLSGTKAKNDIAQSWDDYMRELSTKNPALLEGCTHNFQKSGPITNANDPFYKKMIAHREKGCGKNPTVCTIYREDDRRCAAASVAATAAYLGMIDKILAKAVACHQIEWWQVDDSRIALALAYNAGEGTAQNALKLGSNQSLMSTNILDFSKVGKDKKKEMWGHFRALRNCLQKGNYGSPAVGTPEKRACFGLKPETTANRISR